MKGRDVILRRELRLFPLRGASQRAFPLCLLLAMVIVVESFFEPYALFLVHVAGGGAATQLTSDAVRFIDGLWITLCLMMPSVIVATTLRRDLRNKTHEELIAAGMSPRDYLEGVTLAGFRSCMVLIFAMIIRHIMARLQHDIELNMYASEGMLNMIVMLLMSSALMLFIEIMIIWCTGMLMYSTLTMMLMLRGASVRTALVPSLCIALVLDVLIGHWLAGMGVRLSNMVLAAVTVLPVALAFMKWVIYRWLFDHCVEKFTEWTGG